MHGQRFAEGIEGVAKRWRMTGAQVTAIEKALQEASPIHGPQGSQLDALLRSISKKASVEFVSPLDTTCNADGCIVALQGRPQLLLSFDYGHLTRAGSDFVVQNVLCATSSACDAALDHFKARNPQSR